MGGRALLGAFILVAVMAGGCAQNEISQFSWTPVIKTKPRITNQIVMSENYWIQKEVQLKEEFPGPTPADLRPPEQDYILGPGDLIDISVYELMAPGTPYAMRGRISQTGQITFPYLETVKVAGLTTRGVEEKFKDLLEKDFIKNPQVSVFVEEYRNLNVSVLNGLAQPGLYPMTKLDMPLLDLVAMARGIIPMTEDYGYIIRKYTLDEVDLLKMEAGVAPIEKPAATGSAAAPTGTAPAATGTAAAPTGTAPVAPAKAAPPISKAERDILEKMAEGEMPAVGRIDAAEAAATATAAAPKPPAAAPKPPAVTSTAVATKNDKEFSNWIWSDGKWVQVKAPPTAEEGSGAAAPVAKVTPPAGTVVEEPGTAAASSADTARLQLEAKMQRLGVIQGAGQLRRIIRIDIRALQAGDPTQNVVLRDGDVFTIPSPPIGDFYMAGEVARPGVYSLTGRKITLLQAVAAAGGLSAVAVPWRTEVLRRVSETEEEIIYVDLSKIARGEVPDFYLHPDDLVRVGTDQGAIFNAVLRNAFRATYGMGAVYDMNFADFYPWSAGRHFLFN